MKPLSLSPPNRFSSSAAAGENVLDICPPPEVLRSNLELRRRVSVLLLALLSSLLLGISFAPFDCGFVAYFALVPWALAMAGGVRRRFTLFSGWLAGLLFWAGMVYWLALPTVAGWLAGAAYLSLYWLAAAVLVRRAMRRSLPMWIILPLLWVALEFVRSRVPLLGFPWFLLGQSQYEQTTLIQIADATGQYGVSFFVAMVNGAILDLLYGRLFVLVRGRARLSPHIFLGAILTTVAFVGLLWYGRYRIAQTPAFVSPGPTVGIVQEAFPLSLHGPFTPARVFLEAHARRSLQLIGRKCDLVLWPETMLPAGLNRALLEADVRTMDDPAVRSLAKVMFSEQAARQYDAAALRRAIERKIGPLPMKFYRRAAARFLLRHDLTEAQQRLLTDEQIRRLADRLLPGGSVAERSPAVLRAALRLHRWDAVSSSGGDPDLRAAAGLILNQPVSSATEMEKLVQQVRSLLLAEEEQDDEGLETQRGQAALVETCSLLLGCPILAGGTAYQRFPGEGDEEWGYQNCALWFDADGPGKTEYAKIFLVPFSEYVPGRESWPALYRLLRGLVPDLMPQIRPGETPTRFDLRRNGKSWTVAVPICFEGAIPALCRAMTASGPKDRLLLANLSNDGWFAFRSGRGTTEQAQHLVHSVFRAVENRTPVVRAVNTGISAAISSAGRMESVLEVRVGNSRRRTMIPGVLTAKTLVDRRVSLYSLWGDAFAAMLCLPAVGVAVWLGADARRKSRKDASA